MKRGATSKRSVRRTPRERSRARSANAAQRLREGAKNLEAATRSGTWTYDIESRRFEASAGYVALFAADIAPEKVTLEWVHSHLTSSQLRRLKAEMARGIESAKHFSFTIVYTAEDGSERYAENHAWPELGGKGVVKTLYGVARDVTEMVLLRRTLDALEQRHRLVFEQSIDVISHVDRHGRFVFVSPSSEELTGFPIAEATTKTVADMTHPDDFPMLLENSKSWQHDHTPRTLQYRTLTKSGKYVWIESTIRPVIDSTTGEVLGALSISRDIRERRRVEEELRLAHERSEIANRAKSRFLANMSHELRTPLNAIIGFSEILSREMFGPLGTPRYKEYSDLILESGRLLLDLINDLLDMSKIEAGRYVLAPDALDMEDLLGTTVRLVQRQAEAKDLKLKVEAGKLSSPLIADQRAVKQIVLNLLSNAIKFTPTGGEITLGASESEAYVTITVSDTGIGIPQSALGRLAKPFEQAHGDLNVSQKGTGLGLALVRSLARLHGGEIDIESREGEGTTVYVHLPHEPIKKPAKLAKTA